jgi:hypothetical protein
MSTSRGIHKGLDQDLIAKLARGWKPSDHVEPAKQQRPPRPAESYRGARRNRVLRVKPKGVWGSEHYYFKHTRKRRRV